MLYGLPMRRGWALLAYVKETLPLGGLELASDGYIAQERDRLKN